MAIDIYTTPALKPPPGVTPNLVDPPESGYPDFIATASICMTFVILSIAARTFVKVHIFKQVHLEDYALWTSGLAVAAHIALVFFAIQAGQGRHQWNVSIAGAQRVAYFAYVSELVYCFVVFTKISVLLQMKRIFRGPETAERDSVYWCFVVLIWANLAAAVSVGFGVLFTCNPREKFWNSQLPGKCIDENALLVFSPTMNIFSDILMILAPIHGIRKLKVPLKKKLGVAAIFGTGIFATITSIIRLVYSIQLVRATDQTWAIAPLGILGDIEATLIIMIAAAPTMPKLVKYLAGKTEKTQPSTRTYTRHVEQASPGGGPAISDGSLLQLRTEDLSSSTTTVFKEPKAMEEGVRSMDVAHVRGYNPSEKETALTEWPITGSSHSSQPGIKNVHIDQDSRPPKKQ